MKDRKRERKMTPFERQKERMIDGSLRACLFKARVGIVGAEEEHGTQMWQEHGTQM